MSCSTSRIANPRSSCTARSVLASAAVSDPVEPRRWLVEEHQARLGHQRPTDLDESALAEAQALDRLVGEVAQAEQFEHLVGAGDLVGPGLAAEKDVAPPLPLAPADPVGDDEVVAHGRVGEQLDPLERPADAEPGAFVDAEPGDVGAVELDDATVGPQDAEDAVEERRLAGAVRADQPDALALLDVDVDVIERDDARRTSCGRRGW